MSRRLRLCAVALAVGLMPAAVSLSAPVAAAESIHASGTTANGEWVLDVPADFNGTCWCGRTAIRSPRCPGRMHRMWRSATHF